MTFPQINLTMAHNSLLLEACSLLHRKPLPNELPFTLAELALVSF